MKKQIVLSLLIGAMLFTTPRQRRILGSCAGKFLIVTGNRFGLTNLAYTRRLADTWHYLDP